MVFKTHKDLPPGPISTELISTINKTGTWRSFRPVIDDKKCTRCYLCWKYCPDVAIEIEAEKVKINYDFCKGCGLCAEDCPKKAITMVMEE